MQNFIDLIIAVHEMYVQGNAEVKRVILLFGEGEVGGRQNRQLL